MNQIHATNKSRRSKAAVLVTAAAIGLAACGGSGGYRATASDRTARNISPAFTPTTADGASVPGVKEPGKPPRSFACADFGPGLLTGPLKAADAKVSFVQVEEPGPAAQGVKECDFTFAANQQPLDADDAGDVRVDVIVENPSEQYALAPADVPKSFDHDRDVSQAQAAAPPTVNQVARYQSLPGLGLEAYVADYLNRQDDETDSGLVSHVMVLRNSQPEVLDVELSYDLKPDTSIAAVPKAQDPFQNDRHLQTVIELARAVAARIDGPAGHGDSTLNTDSPTTMLSSTLPAPSQDESS